MVWVAIAAGLAYAAWFWPQHEPSTVADAGAPVTDSRSFPYEAPAPAAEPPPLKFGDYPCAGDCSAHRAGYRWAQANSISDPDSCTGDSAEFIEGCRVYARERAAILRND